MSDVSGITCESSDGDLSSQGEYQKNSFLVSSSDEGSSFVLTQVSDKSARKKKGKRKCKKKKKKGKKPTKELFTDDEISSVSSEDSLGSTKIADPCQSKEAFKGCFLKSASMVFDRDDDSLLSDAVELNRYFAKFKLCLNRLKTTMSKQVRNEVSGDVLKYHSLYTTIADNLGEKNGSRWENNPNLSDFYKRGLLPRYRAKTKSSNKFAKPFVTKRKSSKGSNESLNMNGKFNFDDIVVNDDDDDVEMVGGPRRKRLTVGRYLKEMSASGKSNIGNLRDVSSKLESVAWAAYRKLYGKMPEKHNSRSAEYQCYSYDDNEETRDFLRGALFRAFYLIAEDAARRGRTNLVAHDMEPGVENKPQQQRHRAKSSRKRKHGSSSSSSGSARRGSSSRQKRCKPVVVSDDDDDEDDDEDDVAGEGSGNDNEEKDLKNGHGSSSFSSSRNASSVSTFTIPPEFAPSSSSGNSNRIYISTVLEEKGINSTNTLPDVYREVRMNIGKKMWERDNANNVLRKREPQSNQYGKHPPIYTLEDKPAMLEAAEEVLKELNVSP